jgi:hypothetical protein
MSSPDRQSVPGLSLSRRARLLVKSWSNFHRPGPLPDVFLFATPRSGSTWLMEIIASQPGFKYYDEPLNPRRENVQYGGLFPDFESLMPEAGNDDRIIEYFRGMQQGQHRYMNPPPLRRHHRLLTNRVVFKIHEVDHLARRIAADCGGDLLYLIRHPISNSISRTVQPRLQLFLASPYYAQLVGDEKRLREIRAIALNGTSFQRAITSWCFENLSLLRFPTERQITITYEEMVLNPEKSADFLMRRLALPERDALLAAFERPSFNIKMSRAETIAAMQSEDAARKRAFLVTKWLAMVSEQHYSQAEYLLAVFGIGGYDVRKPLANREVLHFPDTQSKLSR